MNFVEMICRLPSLNAHHYHKLHSVQLFLETLYYMVHAITFVFRLVITLKSPVSIISCLQ